jgi:hypothetical protein
VSVYQTDAAARAQRVADIVRRKYLGDTLEEIGQDYGISRERVRQIVAKHAPDAPRQQGNICDPLAIMRLIRSPETRSLTSVAQALGIHHTTLHHAVRHLGIGEAAQRLFRWRRRAACRTQVVAELQRFAAEHGRAPTVDELNSGRCGKAYTSRIYQGFGALREAFAAAGLDGRPTGWHGRLDRLGGAA